MTETRSVSTSPARVDGLALATGRAHFTPDIPLEHPLHVALVASPHACAEVESVDAEACLAVEGVVTVLHCHNAYERMPPVLFTTAGQGSPEPSPYDTRLFNRKVRYAGELVAAVAATSREAAREGARRLEVSYTPLPANTDPEQAMEPGTPVLHGEEAHTVIDVPYAPERNMAAATTFDHGRFESAYKGAERRIDVSFTTQQASHCALEPHNVAVSFDDQGRLVITSSTQVPFHVRRITARVLSIPLRTVRVIKPKVGGSYGGKQEVFLEPVAARIALDTGRPVRLQLTRREVFTMARTRHPMRTRIQAGFGSDGEIAALAMDCLMDTGAYGTHALTVLSNVGSKVLPLFNKIDNIRLRGHAVYTNTTPGGAYRGYGATQAYFAFNQVLDMIARECKEDFVSFVKRRHIREGETSPVFAAIGEGTEGVAQTIASCTLSECLDRGAAAIGWHDKRDQRQKTATGRIRGVGAAVAMQGSGIPLVDMGSAAMKANEDGSFNLMAGATEIGTGSDTICCQIAAEALDTDPSMIIPHTSDTDTTPFDTGAYASSGTYVSGKAVEKCARNMRRNLLRAAAEELAVSSDELTVENGVIRHSSDPSIHLSYGELVGRRLYNHHQEQLQAFASHCPTSSPPPFIAQFAEVEADPETGEVRVTAFVSAVDCGIAINPQLARGQVEGGVVNGIGFALTEEYLRDSKSRMTNPSFGGYKIPGAPDIPALTTILVESREPTGPYGAKSIGEVCINGPGPAIANAIYDALGVRMHHQPFTPERVWRALREQEGRR
ncbi:MAG: molybdopterin-dependent oxidoreductase [Synergistales bacterium]|nr:molybdopterin-dependent oxidoreductase [Synergistales bacterium]